MDGQKKYVSFIIPQRDSAMVREPAQSAAADCGEKLSIQKAPLSGVGFAEVEIGSSENNVTPSEKALQFFSSVSQPEPIEQKAYDPIRLKFYEMRKLATDRPFARDDSELFYKQAKFMEGYLDDYAGDTKCLIYAPYYQHMGYEQLRTYFTWRTKARSGEILPTSMSYIFLYIYELINNIGVADPGDGLEKLLAVWNSCQKFTTALDSYMPMWLKDYHIYYNPPRSFQDFVKEYNMYRYYTVSFLFDSDAENSLELWNSLSSYDVTSSRFYKDGNEQLFKDCFYAVLDGIRDLCASNNCSIEDLFVYSISKRIPWRPYRHALYYNWYQQPDRIVEMPGQERYYCKNNQWSTNLPMYYSTQKNFVGYIIKKTEACLRESVKYKYKFKVDPDIRYHEYFAELKGLESRLAGLNSAIEKAIAAFLKERKRTIVKVDHTNLARIRMEAQGTQEKLIVPEEAGEFGLRTPEFGLVGSDQRREVEDRGGDDGGRFGNQSPEFGIAGDNNGWGFLRDALSPVERKALALVLQEGADIRAFADENGIMLEVLADGINEKAADYIGDSILDMDDGIALYEDYIDIVAEMVG